MALYHGSTSLSLISSDSSSDDEFDEYQNILNQVAVSVVPLLHHHIRTNACFMEMQNQKGKHGGSTFGRIYIRRARVSTAYQLEQDYFVENSTYLDADFRSCYRMSKKLFLRILADVEKRDQYFVQKNDAIGRPGLTSKIKRRGDISDDDDEDDI
ncbi:hypothetical protein IFM89_001654 [Coptis chinensis]|uniref:Uncharacterized protein n=1 Tax=Coptis chinensis TaxID=261450 RepID=A0A835LL78_9MAGN|nr:hypothetical protein IFM89_001654 [Coptis chinensis]